MWFKSSGTEMHKWLTVKPSLLKDAGYGLFAERKFKLGDNISIYLGNVLTETEDTESHYRLQCTIPGSKESMTLDLKEGGFPSSKLMYLGAHMINDPELTVDKDEKDENAFNVKFAQDLKVVAEKEINIGDELLSNYYYQ